MHGPVEIGDAAFVIKEGTGPIFRPRITPVAQGAKGQRSYTSRIAHRLSDFRRLRYAPDFCALNNRLSASTRMRRHAFARCSSGRRIRNEIRGSTQGESLSGRFDVCCSGC